MSVTELHRSGAHAAPVHGHVVPRVPSIAVLIVEQSPDAHDLAHLCEGFEVVLIAHDTAAAAAVLHGLGQPQAVAPSEPPHAMAHLSEAADVVAFDDGLAGLELDTLHQLATWHGRPLPFTGRERDILKCLIEAPRRVWSYRDLYEHVWGGYYLGDPSLVHSALKRIRRKLREAGVDWSIDAVRGVGFRAVPLT